MCKMNSPRESTYVLAILSLLAFFAKITFNALGALGLGPFPNNQKNVSAMFELDITPAGWAFSIWSLIYIWNAGYVIYGVTTAFRDVPAVLNNLFFMLYIFCDIFNVSWIFAFSHTNIEASAVVLIANQASLYFILFVAYRNYQTYKKQLEKSYKPDAWCVRILVENGIMMNTAWVTIATLLNVTMVLVYRLQMPQQLACCIALTLLLLIALVWFTLQNFVFQDALNYSYTDWPVLIWALAASLVKNWDPSKLSARYSLGLVILAGLMLIVRIALQVVRNKKDPNLSLSKSELIVRS